MKVFIIFSILIFAVLISFYSICISQNISNKTEIKFIKGEQKLGDTRSFGISAADVDMDNDNDIFICNYVGESKLWLNDGTGHFEMSNQSFFNNEAHGVKIADFNGDGFPDLFILYHASSCKIYFNDGKGNFTDSDQDIGTIEEYPGMLVTGDVDNDGDIDAFISYYKIPNRLWINNGKGFFTKSETEFGPEGDPGYMDLSDFNEDTFLDLFLCMTNSPDQVFLNDGNGNFKRTAQEFGIETGAVLSRDIDGDGDNDAVVVNNTNGMQIWLNKNNNGEFTKGPFYNVKNMTLTFNLFDPDLDGDFDIITSDKEGGNLLWLNDGSGNFTLSKAVFGNSRVNSIGCTDIDNDGDIDLVFGQSENTGGNSIYINRSLHLSEEIR